MEATIIMKEIKSFGSISVSLLTITVMLLVLACGGDSDDESNGGTGGDSASTGGSSGGGASGTGGSSGGTTSGGSGGSSDMDAGQIDGSTPEPLPTDVAEGGECTMQYQIAGLVSLFTSYGVCQSDSASCTGGTPDKFDIAKILPAGSETIAALLPPPTSDAANCASGLVCCIKEDQCDAVSAQISDPNSIVALMMPGIKASCSAAGSCTATNADESAGELETGCPSGETCCVVLPPINMEAGIPGLLPTGDASTPAADASAPAADAGEGQ